MLYHEGEYQDYMWARVKAEAVDLSQWRMWLTRSCSFRQELDLRESGTINAGRFPLAT